MRELGKIKRIEPGTVWDNEPRDFTPWLEDNLTLLSETLGMDLELVGREVPAGNLSVDLVAKDVRSDRLVIIENQLERSDHDHLGKLLTYAANKGASVVVWISPNIRDEHRETLDWLNRVAEEDIDFFGIELQVLQIDESIPAPYFDVVAKPNSWRKEDRGRRKATPRQQLYHQFFQNLLANLKAEAPNFTSSNKVDNENYFKCSAGRAGFSYSFSFTQNNRFRIELYIDTGDAETTKKAFDLLIEDEGSIKEEFELTVDWDRLDEKRACRLSVYYPQSISIDDSTEVLSDLRKWAVQTGIRFRGAMRDRIRRLDL